MWFETHLGTKYEVPDMLEDHVGKAHKALDHSAIDSKIIISNISEVTVVIPKRIIKKAGVGERCFWEAL